MEVENVPKELGMPSRKSSSAGRGELGRLSISLQGKMLGTALLAGWPPEAHNSSARADCGAMSRGDIAGRSTPYPAEYEVKAYPG